MENIKLDLHTHSILSPDGGLSESGYQILLEKKILDCIAVTDHNQIDFAVSLQKKLGKQIIIGEEIMSTDGEIIGLFLLEKISAGLSAEKTIAEIKKQKGLVYIPHPFETLRKGISENILQSILDGIDILEVYNGRSMQPATRVMACDYAQTYGIARAASSDAHCRVGIGKTYSMISELPEQNTLISLVKKGSLEETRAPWLAFLCPKMNRIIKRMTNQT